jgi:PAT family beta-lactamase induction signal transducer AmpG
VFFYKFADQLAQSLTRPFLIDMGYNSVDRGVALASVGALATIVGTFFGGFVTTLIGLGPSLWIFGFLQIFSNVGYFLVAGSEINRPLMYGATGFELLTSGMGTGAFSVLLLRMTQRRFSATQYALFSSLFGLPRVLAGPISGFLVDAMGWRTFFLFTMACAIPGMTLLSRFVPLGVREPKFEVRPPTKREPLSASQLAYRGLVGGILGAVSACLVVAALAALKALRIEGGSFDFAASLVGLLHPVEITGWLQIVGILVFGLACALLTAAVIAARHGAASRGATTGEIH